MDENVTKQTSSGMEALLEHIERAGLDLTPRAETSSDGNCWYDAIADQIVLHNVPDLPTNHKDLRKAVVDSIPNLPQFKEWEEILKGQDDNMESFMKRHAQLGTWTDDNGFMVQATVLYIGRPVHIVGTSNIGGENNMGYTVMETRHGSNTMKPFTVGYIDGNHYQSLQEYLVFYAE